MRAILALALASCALATACRGADDTLTPTQLPGFELSLPGWPEMQRGDRWMADRVTLGSERDERMLMLQWSPASAGWTAEELQATLEAARAAFPQLAAISLPTPRQVAGHDGLEAPVRIEHVEGRVTTWFCPEHERQVMLLTLAPAAVHDGVVASVKCHTSAPPAGAKDDKALFPKLDPPPGMKRQEDGDPSMQMWLTDSGVALVLMAGTPGDTMKAVPEAMMVETVKRMVVVGGMTDVGRVSASRALGGDDVERRIFSTDAKVDGATMDVRIALWFCTAADRTFIAMHMSAAGAIDGFTAEQHLLRATCP